MKLGVTFGSLALAGLFQLAVAGAAGASTQWTAAERQQAQKGAFPTRDLPAAAGATVEALAYVPAPPSRVLAVLWAHERFPEFMPNARSARILQRLAANHHVVEQVGGHGPLSVRVVTDRQRLADGVRWKAIDGDLKANEGFWKLEAAPQGTWVTYHIHLEPKQSAVPDAVTAFLQRQALPSMLRSVVKRIVVSP